MAMLQLYNRIVISSGIVLTTLTGSLSAVEAKSSLEELRELYQIAEDAMARQGYATARIAYLDMLTLGAKELANKNAYASILMRLASAEAHLKAFDSAESRLQELLKSEPENKLLLAIESLRAQFKHEQNQTEDAYLILKNLEKLVASEEWSADQHSFFLGLEYSLNRKYSDILAHAQRLVDAALYTESVPLFIEVLEALEKRTYPAVNTKSREGLEEKIRNIRLRLAEAHFQSGSFSEAVNVLEYLSKEVFTKGTTPYSEVDKGILYLLARSYQKLDKREHAINSFKSYLELGTKRSLVYHSEVSWQLGLLNFQREDFEEAESYFQTLAHHDSDVRLYYLSRLYIARIHLHRKEYEAVEQAIYPLLGIIPEKESLRYEAAFIHAEAFYQRGLYSKAAEYFEKAIPKRNKIKAAWYPRTLFNLAWSYLKLGEQAGIEKQPNPLFFERAEKAFKELISFNQNEKAFLGLARVYLLKGESDQDAQSLADVETLLAGQKGFNSLEVQAEALLLRGEVASTYEQRKEIYSLLTQEKFAALRPYSMGLYYLALNEFEEGQRLMKNGGAFLEASLFLTRSSDAFQRAFRNLTDVDPEKAALSLKYAAQSQYYLNTKAARMSAYHLLDSLVHKHNALFLKINQQDEVLYLLGVVASRILYEDGLADFQEPAQRALSQVVDKHVKGPFVDDALNLLGTILFRQGLYQEAERAFVRLAAQHPKSPYAASSWFWAAECADWQHKDVEVVREYRRQVFENYPKSKRAANAYFNYYAFADYLQGNPEALGHLQNMELLYSQSPYLIVAQYLLGMNHKQDRKSSDGTVWKSADLNAAIHAFEEARHAFDAAYENNLIPQASLEYFVTVRYRALLERALVKLRQATEVEGAKKQVYLEWAEEAFEEIRLDFQNKAHSLTPIVARGTIYPRIQEESDFGLVQTLVAAKKDIEAEALIAQMLEKYAQANVKRGYYLARTWYEQGRIALKRSEGELALNFLQHAENAAKGRVLSTEQKLDLWIQQSSCHRDIGDFDEAMRLLSRVINEDTVSTLRLKAMYLRSEVYELQGRHELAVKQLEATARKGGAWAQKAQEKLEKDYGFN